MIDITQDQAQQRFLTLPESLQDALFSVDLSEKIITIGESAELNEDQSFKLSDLVNWVFLGFLQPDEVAAELTQAGVVTKAAGTIQASLNAKIFAPLRADIDKVYKTASGIPQPVSSQPAIIQDINAPKDFRKGAPIPVPPVASAAPTPTSIADLSRQGWSKMKTDGPMAIKTTITPPSSLGKTASPNPAGPMPVPTLAVPSTPPPAPVILQRETPASAAQQKNAGFHLSRPTGEAQMEFSQAKPEMKVMPAVIEFNKENDLLEKAATGQIPPTPSATSVAHYSEFKSSLASIPTADSGSRKVTEITSVPIPAPTPASIPIPKPPSSPIPSPAGTPKPNIIIKNFPEAGK